MFHPRGPTFFELVRQALSSTERGYDLLAPKFEYTPFRTPDALLCAAAEHIGGPRSVRRAIDLCCGTGAAMRMLRPLCREEVLGVDFSAGMLAQATRQLDRAPGAATLRLQQADVCELQVAEPYDVATCFGALGHIPRDRQDAFAAAVARVVRPGGRFVFATAWRPPWRSRRAMLARGFNLLMAVRNRLWAPPFVMYYLQFTLPGVLELLERHRFESAVHEPGLAGALAPVRIVVATRG